VAQSKISSVIKLSLLLLFIAAAVYFFLFTDTGRSITPAAVIDYIRDFHPVASRVVYILFYILGSVVLLPGTILSFAGAILFGPYEGTLYTWVGAVLGSVLAFLLAKSLGRDFVDRLLGGRFQAFDRRIREHGFTGLLIIRLVPIFPFNGVNFASGLTSISLRDYTLATAIGIVPGTFVFQYVFYHVGTPILEEGFKLEHLWNAELLFALGLFVVFVIAGKWLAGKLQKKDGETS
jgi:uncharacterized membrane protein YdjX (TVP38/TMEM64 family)